MMDECEIVCFLPDWWESCGACGEFARAKFQKKTIFQFKDLETEV